MSHIVLATLLRCQRTPATKLISITFGDWNNVDCKDEAMRLAVGGEFDAVGKLEYYLLRSLGLSSGHLVIDVGCGSGRLAQRYVGTDVVPRLLESAKALTDRNDWEFSLVEGIRIPRSDNVAVSSRSSPFSPTLPTRKVFNISWRQRAA